MAESSFGFMGDLDQNRLQIAGVQLFYFVMIKSCYNAAPTGLP